MAFIEFKNVSKIFARQGHRRLLRGHVKQWFRGSSPEPFYALKNLSFRIKRGECVAIVGPNGAGKSTMLGLVAGLASPDEGTVRVEGKFSAMLELGSGFHPDLTGIENIYLNASLLGLTRERTDEVLNQIIEFSELDDFIGEPLRTYSTGMILRLAFSVAVCVEPDFLIIDELLAVGDQKFQSKCLEWIGEFKRSGGSLICVSHAPALAETLCERAIWLDHGEVMMDGKSTRVVKTYTGRLYEQAPDA